MSRALGRSMKVRELKARSEVSGSVFDVYPELAELRPDLAQTSLKEPPAWRTGVIEGSVEELLAEQEQDEPQWVDADFGETFTDLDELFDAVVRLNQQESLHAEVTLDRAENCVLVQVLAIFTQDAMTALSSLVPPSQIRSEYSYALGNTTLYVYLEAQSNESLFEQEPDEPRQRPPRQQPARGEPTPRQATPRQPAARQPAARQPAPAPVAPPAKATGKSTDAWDQLAPDTKHMIQAIAKAARDRQTVRIRYRPKVTTGKAVYRTVAPYSLRWREVHTRGYDNSPVLTPVFFGYDDYEKTIKMFVCDRIITVERMSRSFSPQWDVEFEHSARKLVANLMESDRAGQCYALAGGWLLKHGQGSDATLVHGLIHSLNPNVPHPDLEHAWIEKDDKIWEPMQDRWWDKDEFYALFDPEDETVYDYAGMRDEILRTEHWGPWESIEEQTTEPEQDLAVDQMLTRYEAEPTSLWLYSNLPIEDRMALAYLGADNMMGAPYRGDQVRHFAAALEMVTEPPEGFWQQIREKDPLRAQRLQSLDWSLEAVPLDRVGVWHRFGGFPDEWCHGSVVDTAAALAAGTENPEKRAEVLDIASQWATVNKFLPPILVPGGMIRTEPGYEQMDWDIDDGNHRMVASALGGAKEVVAFVGRPKVPVEGVEEQAGLYMDYTKFRRLIFQDIVQGFLPGMLKAKSDPLDDMVVTTLPLADYGLLLGVSPAKSSEFAARMAEEHGLEHRPDEDTLLVTWANLPKEHQQSARHLAKTLRLQFEVDKQEELEDVEIDEITGSGGVGAYQGLGWARPKKKKRKKRREWEMPLGQGPYKRRKRKSKRKSGAEKAVQALLDK